MALALPADLQAEFLGGYDSHIVEQHGRVMRDFVAVPARLLAQTSELQPWFDASFEWTGSRKPKPTSRPKKQVP
jgi:hypothetical protein